jgi:hypothetical protein
MKTLFRTVCMTFACFCIGFAASAQCDFSELSVAIKSTSPSGENCTVNVTVSFTIEKNKGNKYTYVHLWTPSTYPGFDYKKAPDKADLGKVLATVAIYTDGTASLLPNYGPDNTVPTLYAGLSIAEESLGDKLYKITVSNLSFEVPGACSGIKSLKGDVWGTQSEADKHPPVHCVNTTTLPVKLARFKGDLLDNAVALSWVTTEEAGSSRFDIERSGDSNEFFTLGSVSASGTTRTDQHYSFVDESPLRGNNYYRLKMVDTDGTTERSRIIVVENEANSVAFELLGNPASSSEIRFILKNSRSENVTLHDLSGKRMGFQINKAGNIVSLKPNTILHSGIYILGLGDVPAMTKKVLVP